MTDDRIEAIETDAALSNDEKRRRLEAIVASLHAKADDARMPMESQDGHALIDAQRALERLSKVTQAS